MQKRSDLVLLLARILLGVIFLLSGYGKLTHLEGFAASLASRGVPASGVLGPLGACVEFFGGLAVIVGAEVRWASALMILFVVVATLISHRYWELQGAARQAQQGQFMKNLAIIGGFLALGAAGGGRLALERLWRRS